MQKVEIELQLLDGDDPRYQVDLGKLLRIEEDLASNRPWHLLRFESAEGAEGMHDLIPVGSVVRMRVWDLGPDAKGAELTGAVAKPFEEMSWSEVDALGRRPMQAESAAADAEGGYRLPAEMAEILLHPAVCVEPAGMDHAEDEAAEVTQADPEPAVVATAAIAESGEGAGAAEDDSPVPFNVTEPAQENAE